MSTNYKQLLGLLGACDDAREWNEDFTDPAAAWAGCDRPTWVAWVATRVGLGRRALSAAYRLMPPEIAKLVPADLDAYLAGDTDATPEIVDRSSSESPLAYQAARFAYYTTQAFGLSHERSRADTAGFAARAVARAITLSDVPAGADPAEWARSAGHGCERAAYARARVIVCDAIRAEIGLDELLAAAEAKAVKLA